MGRVIAVDWETQERIEAAYAAAVYKATVKVGRQLQGLEPAPKRMSRVGRKIVVERAKVYVKPYLVEPVA